MIVNWALVGVLALTVAGGVGIGLIAAPKKRNRRTFVVVRSWFDPQGLEILYESRSLKSAQAWYNRHRNDYGDVTLRVYDRDRVDEYNAQATGNPKFWLTVAALDKAASELQDARYALTALQGELERRKAEPVQDSAFTVSLKQTVTDTAGMILDEIRRMNSIEASPRDQREPGSVMPQFDPTESMSLEAAATAAREQPVPPAGLPSVRLLKPTAKPKTQTVVLKFGQDNRLE